MKFRQWVKSFDAVERYPAKREPFREVLHEPLEPLAWTYYLFPDIGEVLIDGWKALRGGVFTVPDPRPHPPLTQLSGHHIGSDLMRYDGRTKTWLQRFGNSCALRNNAALCARGLDRWEGDGGAV